MEASPITPSGSVLEVNLYRVLSKFSQNAWVSSDNAKECSEQLLTAIQKLLSANMALSDELIFHLALTIKATLYRDSNRLVIKEQRSIPRPPRLHVMKEAFPIIYKIYATIGFDRCKREVDGTALCIDTTNLFICPRPPPLTGNIYLNRQFDIPSHNTPKHIPFVDIQHAVHNVDDLFSILGLVQNAPNSSQSIEVHFIGGPNHAYHGPDFIWFSPRPSRPLPAEIHVPCPSLNTQSSVYGNYLFCIPFRNLSEFKTYRLGTRKYDKEFCHSILFTKQDVQSVQLEEELQSVPLNETGFINTGDNHSFNWLSYRTSVGEYDQVDFAIAESELKWNTHDHGVRLNFIDHSDCVRNKFIHRVTDCVSSTRLDAMQEFKRKLVEKNIALISLKTLFDEAVYKELEHLLLCNQSIAQSPQPNNPQ